MEKKINAKEIFMLIFSMFFVSVAVYYIMMPSGFVVGSISGFLMVVAHFVPLQLSTLTLITNMLLLVVGFIFIGKEFGGKTVITSILLPVYLRIFETITPHVEPLTSDIFVNVLCYIMVIGFGQAMLFNINASSGGLDIVAKLLNKYIHVEIGKGLTIAGFVTAASSILVYDKEILVISLLGTYISGVVIDYFIDGFHMRKKVCILSEHYTDIQEFIVKKLNRGATLYKAYGGWDNREMMELVTILQQNEYASLLEYVHSVDPKAFITVATVGSVIGQWNPHRKKID